MSNYTTQSYFIGLFVFVVLLVGLLLLLLLLLFCFALRSQDEHLLQFQSPVSLKFVVLELLSVFGQYPPLGSLTKLCRLDGMIIHFCYILQKITGKVSTKRM